MITKHPFTVFGHSSTRYQCECGWQSPSYPDDRLDELDAIVRAHLADEHGDQFDVGRCEKCGQPTEHFRAVTPHGTLFLCETHSPAMSDLDVTVPAP